jgi:predicted nucleic acid-binding protein
MRSVLDANVSVSAAISSGPSHRIVQAWLRDQPFELLICDRLVGEVRSVLTERPRLRKWISLEAAEPYITALATGADLQPEPGPGPALTRDPDDDYVIHLAPCPRRRLRRQRRCRSSRVARTASTGDPAGRRFEARLGQR